MLIKTIIIISLLTVLACASKKEINLVTPFKNHINQLIDYSDIDETAKNLIDNGLNKYIAGDYTNATPLFESANFIENVPAAIKRALFYCYMTSGQYESALKLAENLLKEAPAESISYEQTGIAHLWLGNIKAAIDNFKKALEFEQFSPKIYFFLGLAYERQNDIKNRDGSFKSAENEYQQVLKMNPFDFETNYELAELYIYWKKNLEIVDKLIGSLKEGLLKNDYTSLNEIYQNSYIPLLISKYKCLTGKYNESLKDLYKILEYRIMSLGGPHLIEVYFYIGKNYLMLGNKEKARLFFEKVKHLAPKDPYVFIIEKELKF